MDKKSFGTEADGKPAAEWCKQCYENGAFTTPNMTLDEMLTQNMKRLMKEEKISDDQANVLAHAVIPQLKRWRGQSHE
jgi:hypothetical protein